MRVETGFQPTPFSETNAYVDDPVLPSLLKRLLSQSAFQEIEPDLVRLGHDVVTVLRPLSDSGKAYNPKLIQYDQWGRRIDDLQTSEAWRELKAFGQKEGIPGIFYERKFGAESRIYGFAKAVLMAADNHYVFCPLSMTDGCARVLELFGTPQLKKDILPRLISRDPTAAFTSGQWMTERPGGSDVSLTETNATPVGETTAYGAKYTLDGFKWFSSATDSDVAVALARTGTLEQGSKGLSLFFIPLRFPLIRNPGEPVPSAITNKIYVHRLKNKLGTQLVPTAELSLEGSEAYLIGELGKGVKNITPVLNITRIWSAISGLSGLRKCLAIATSYSQVRSIQGGRLLLQDTPIHVAQLASVSVLYRGLVHLVFGSITLMGRVECNVATPEEERRLRLMTPVVKAYVAERACAGLEEAMTALGGAGYMDENGIGRTIRDCLVEKIWEGTIVVLALDLARAAQDPSIIQAYISWAETILHSVGPALTEEFKSQLALLRVAIGEFATSYKGPIPPLLPRPALMLAGALTSALHLLEHVTWACQANEPTKDVEIEIFKRWMVESQLAGLVDAVVETKTTDSSRRVALSQAIVYGSPQTGAKAKM